MKWNCWRILNRPLGQTLDQLDNQFKVGSFGKVPVFEGGPVEKDKLIVAAWEWLDSPTSFKLYFGIDLEKAESFVLITQISILLAFGAFWLVAWSVGKRIRTRFMDCFYT